MWPVAFWGVASYSSVRGYQRSGGTYPDVGAVLVRKLLEDINAYLETNYLIC
jgi:hypothetical protein